MELHRPPAPKILTPFQFFTPEESEVNIRDFSPHPIPVEEAVEIISPEPAPKDSSVLDSVLSSETEESPEPPDEPVNPDANSDAPKETDPGWIRRPVVKSVGS